MKTLKIAVLGAGFCGMASAYHLTKYCDKGIEIEITILDPGEVGENASGISAGLLHSYAGAHAKLVKVGVEGQAATLELANAAQEALGSLVAIKTGLLRVAISDQQKEDFFYSSQHDDVRWCEAEECQQLYPGMVSEPGIFIESAYIVKTKQYLEGLWKVCKNKGVVWHKRMVSSLSELDAFDAVIVAAGSKITSLPELSHLPIRQVKGQILEIRWPEYLSQLDKPINSKAYIVPAPTPSRISSEGGLRSESDKCIIGATFERNFSSEKPDLDYALEYLLPKVTAIFPDLKSPEILACRSGVRASAPGHIPMLKREFNNVWVIAGMGSKGLLYHALYSKKLVDDVMNSLVPSASS